MPLYKYNAFDSFFFLATHTRYLSTQKVHLKITVQFNCSRCKCIFTYCIVVCSMCKQTKNCDVWFRLHNRKQSKCIGIFFCHYKYDWELAKFGNITNQTNKYHKDNLKKLRFLFQFFQCAILKKRNKKSKYNIKNGRKITNGIS